MDNNLFAAEVEVLRNVVSNLGWKLVKQEINSTDINITLNKTFLNSSSDPEPGPD